MFLSDGNFVSSANCVNTGVANETVVVAFEVEDVGSPPPHVKTKFKIKHKGKQHKFDLDSPGHRKGKDKKKKS